MLLISADILFIIFHVLRLFIRRYFPSIYILNTFTEGVFSISRDLGLAESFQYVKEFWIILLLIYIFIKKRELIFIVFSLIFMFIFADDLLMLHEKLGTDICDYFSYPQLLGLRGQDLGEVTVYAFFGLFFFILLIVAYYRSNNELRIIGRNLFLLLIIFGFFGGVIDMIDSLIRNYKDIQRIMKILEDGGEMILMSSICWYVFTLSNKIDEGNILSSQELHSKEDYY